LDVAALLRQSNADHDLIAAGLLHDSVERGTLSEAELRSTMGKDIGSLVMALSEDASIEPFERRKKALREQVIVAGERALTVFAADKLSCIKGLRRGIEADAKATEERTESSLAPLVNHYRDSVETVAAIDPESPFLPALRSEFDHLATLCPPGAEASAKT
jgi:(p)ppGpp synthase/HD superfamily hydrolase